FESKVEPLEPKAPKFLKQLDPDIVVGPGGAAHKWVELAGNGFFASNLPGYRAPYLEWLDAILPSPRPSLGTGRQPLIDLLPFLVNLAGGTDPNELNKSAVDSLQDLLPSFLPRTTVISSAAGQPFTVSFRFQDVQ